MTSEIPAAATTDATPDNSGSEHNPTPQAATDEKPEGAGAGAAPADEGPAKDDEGHGRRYAAAARKEKAAKERERQLVEKEQALAKERQELEETRRLLDAFDADPIAFLSKKGWTLDRLAQEVLKPLDPTQKEIRELRARLDAKEKAEREAQERAEADRKQAEREAFRGRELDKISAAIEADPDRYELTRAFGLQEEVLNVMVQHFVAAGEVMPVERAADILEDYLTSESRRLSGLKKIAAIVGVKEQEPEGSGAAAAAAASTAEGSTPPADASAKPAKQKGARASLTNKRVGASALRPAKHTQTEAERFKQILARLS